MILAPNEEQTPNINQSANDFTKEIRKLIGPALAVIESLLQDSDPKIKGDTAKWVISYFPELAPKKPKELGGGGDNSSNMNVNLNVNLAMEKMKHIASGARRLENANFTLIPSREPKTIHGKRIGGTEDGDSDEVRESDS